MTFAAMLTSAVEWLPQAFDTSLKAMLILLAAAAAAIAMRRRSAAVRHVIWAGAMGATLILPLIAAFLPAWRILPRGPSDGAPTVTASQSLPRVIPTISVDPVKPPHFDASSTPDPGVLISEQRDMQLTVVEHSEERRQNPRIWILIIWGMGSFILLARIMLAMLGTFIVRRRARPANGPDWDGLLKNICDRIELRRSVELLLGEQRAMPMTWGIRRAKVLLPAEAKDWPISRQKLVLMHELAHVKRWDCLTLAIAQVARAIYWINPLAWVAVARMRIERERACDDLVLTLGAVPVSYAEELVSVATAFRVRFGLKSATIAMARSSKLEGRVRAILDRNHDRRSVTVKFLIAASLVVIVAVPILAVLSGPDPKVPVSIFQWARQRGFSAGLIQNTTLESRWGGWRNLPFVLSPEEEQDARSCYRLVVPVQIVNGVPSFTSDNTRLKLESILRNRPHYFYAEVLLSMWHREHQESPLADKLFEEACHDAPVVAVLQYQLPDGTPLAGVEFDSFSLECNRVQHGWLDPSLVLSYPHLHTDANGCVYLPTYDTVYRTDNMADPDGYLMTYPTLGWFDSISKVAVLPAFVARPNPAAIPVPLVDGKARVVCLLDDDRRIIAKGDRLLIVIDDLEGPGTETRKQMEVGRDSGKIELPNVPQIKAAGLRLVELEKAIVAAYRNANLIQMAQVSVKFDDRSTRARRSRPKEFLTQN